MKDEYDFSNARRGAVVPLPPNQTEVRLRLDNEVLDWLRERVNEVGGGDYFNTINTILRNHIQTQAHEVPVVAKQAQIVEEVVISKTVRVVEEVVVGKTAPERSETSHLQRRK